MTLGTAFAVFAGSLVVSMAASAVLSQRLDQIGRRFHFTAGLVGIITALGADAPEIASAVTALLGGEHELGRGVVFGSNVFNIAALLGLTTILTGRLPVKRFSLALNAGVAFGTTAVIGLQLIGWLNWIVTGALMLAILVPYGFLSSIHPNDIKSLPLRSKISAWLAASMSVVEQKGSSDDESRGLHWTDALAILPLTTIL